MFFSIKRTFQKNKGMGLIETIVAISIFILISVSIYGGFVQILKVTNVLKTKTLAASLANEQMEVVRNLPYADVGIVNGIPSGKISREQTVTRDGITFNITASIQNIDDSFDGKIGESPNDLSPADYKLVEFKIKCEQCNVSDEMTYFTRVSPQSLETQGSNGALFVRVFDANGLPISGANVRIINTQITPAIDIEEITDINGFFQIVDAPTSTNAYQISVTKEGYSEDQTYSTGNVNNPNPNKVDATVSSGQVTQSSFTIDRLSDLLVKTKTASCVSVPDLEFKISGSKTIGENVLKYTSDKITDNDGERNIIGLEWDNYLFEILGSAYDLVGASSVFPLTLNPNNNQQVDLIVAPSEPKSLLVQVTDAQTGLPLSDAYVKIVSSTNNSRTLITGKGFWGQTNWSEGLNQEDFINVNKYFSQDGNIEVSNPAGVVKLISVGNDYVSNGELISSIFDVGAETNFGILTWGNVDQPVNTEAKFQIATNQILTATSTWEFFGPDGTSGSYYTLPDQNINDLHDGDRYLRYKIFLNTNDSNFTPQISNVAFTYNTDCAPPGQVFFQNLNTGNYSLEITKDGYTTYSAQSISINDDWQTYNVIMTP